MTATDAIRLADAACAARNWPPLRVVFHDDGALVSITNADRCAAPTIEEAAAKFVALCEAEYPVPAGGAR